MLFDYKILPWPIYFVSFNFSFSVVKMKLSYNPTIFASIVLLCFACLHVCGTEITQLNSVSDGSTNTTVIKATDSRIRYSGRTYIPAGTATVAFDWSGVTFSFLVNQSSRYETTIQFNSSLMIRPLIIKFSFAVFGSIYLIVAMITKYL